MTRLSGELPNEIVQMIDEYSRPIHRKPEHGIMITKLFDIIKKPFIEKIHYVVNNYSKTKCPETFLHDKELGYLFDSPLQHTPYENIKCGSCLTNYNSKFLTEILKTVKKKVRTKSNKYPAIKDVVCIKKYINTKISNLKFHNNLKFIGNRMDEVFDALLQIQNPSESDIRDSERKIEKLGQILNNLKMKKTGSKNARWKIMFSRFVIRTNPNARQYFEKEMFRIKLIDLAWHDQKLESKKKQNNSSKRVGYKNKLKHYKNNYEKNHGRRIQTLVICL